MAHEFSKLEAAMSPDSIKRSKMMAHQMTVDLLHSQLESQPEMQFSPLRRLIESLGGNLELIAHLPEGDVRITQFDRETA